MILFELNFNDVDYNFRGEVIKLKSKNFDLVLSVIAKSILYNGVDKNGYTLIHSKIFINAFCYYEAYLNYLIYRGIIERDYYIVGKKSWGYRFSDYYKQNVKLNRIIYYPDSKVNDKDNKEVDPNNIKIDPIILKRLKKDFKSCTMKFDLSQYQLEKTYDECGNFIDIGKWLRNNLLLHRWKKGYCTFCFSSNRLYTNFTSLSSHIRKNNILLNNERLVEFDINNSFPLMVAIYMRNENSQIITDYDFKEYCSCVTSGTFYASLMNGLNSIRNCNKKGTENDYSTRLLSKSEVKLLFQIYLNGDNNRQPYLNNLRPNINEYMNMKYPCVHELILNIKEKGKSNMYTTLVQIETQFIFNLIKELYIEFFDIKILTCHDSIYVPIFYRDRVQIIWDRKMKELVKDLPFDGDEDDFLESHIPIFEEDTI